jgi:hypothetical protein
MSVLHDTSIETWADQQHAAAAKSLQGASWYALVTIDCEGKIQILDGQPGPISRHSEHCALVMLEGFAKMHREALECADPVE